MDVHLFCDSLPLATSSTGSGSDRYTQAAVPFNLKMPCQAMQCLFYVHQEVVPRSRFSENRVG